MSVPRVRTAIVWLTVLFAALCWLIAVAPPLVSLALAVTAAIACCVWLERHPEAPVDAEQRADDRATNASPARLSVQVLATTSEGTRCALVAAKRLTNGLDARIVLFVPTPTSLREPFAAGNQAAIVDGHRALAADVGVHVTVLCCVCRRLDDVVHHLVGPSLLVIVGGRRRAWWPGREQRLVSRLTAEGYPVVFAHVGAERVPAGGPVMAP